MAGQDVPDRDAEGGPRKLDEGAHGGYMNEGGKNFKAGALEKIFGQFCRL